jgi:shikimate kinase
MTFQPIIIVGFMGSGKTTVAHELARQLGCRVIDLDELIMEREKRSPKEIIEQDGEERFREIETRMLREVLDEGVARVIAVGGGVWTIAVNRKLMAERAAFVAWLDASFELCWKRIEASGKTRPLARSRAMAQKLYDERRPIYELAGARIKIHENESAEETAKKVAIFRDGGRGFPDKKKRTGLY